LFLIFLSFPSLVFSVTPGVKEQARLHREEGYKLQSRGDIRGALSFYLKAVHMDSSYKEAYNDAGVAYESLGDLQKAEEMYLRAVDIDPNYPAPYANLGFLYEKINRPRKSVFYWKKRFRLGSPGDYWRRKSWEHLQKLGARFPDIKREIMEEEAAQLSIELVYKREQERLENLKEARLHYNLGFDAFAKGLYEDAEKEMLTVIDLDPSDEGLLRDAKKYHKTAREFKVRKKIGAYLDNGFNYLEEGDYLSLTQELRKALALIPEIPRE